MPMIRNATLDDRYAIHDVHLSAFPAEERETIANLAVELLENESSHGTIAIVAEVDGELVGHLAFSPVTIRQNNAWNGSILAPLAVKPEFQKRGIGSALVKQGIEHLTAGGIDVLFVYGDPAYYSRYGFNADTASPYMAPYKLKYPFGWQAMLLKHQSQSDFPTQIECVPALSHPELW